MSLLCQQRNRTLWAAGFFCAASCIALAQGSRRYVEPQWLRFQISEVSLRTDVEVESEKRTVQGSAPISRERVYVAPTLKLIVDGSVYHPNLMEYHIDVEGGAAVQSETLQTGSVKNTETAGNETDTLERYHLMARFFKEKPYITTLYADKDQQFRDYDFFSRVEVDNDQYGLESGYWAGPVPFKLSALHHEEQTIGFDREYSQTDYTVTLRAQNRRGLYDSTEASYTFYDFSRQDQNVATDKGINHSIDLNDTETFGTAERVRLNSTIYYYDLGTQAAPSTSASAQEHMLIKHREHLESSYDYSFDRHTADPAEEDQTHQGQVSLRHQLYESLVSTLDVHGLTQEASGDGSTLGINRYGVGLNESYTKKLDTWGHLSMGYTGRIDQEQRTSSGTTLNVVNESHRLTDGAITLLNQPRVDVSTIRVTDATGAITYRELLDYQVINLGQMTQIQRVPGGLITNGQSVLVSYTVTNQSSADFQTLFNQVQFRLDLFGDLLGLYARYGRTAPSNVDTNVVIVADITDTSVGLDAHWQWLRTGAEYEDYQSNLAPFQTSRLFQSFLFEPTGNSSLSLDLSENWTTYLDANRRLTAYQAIGRYRLQFGPYLAWNVEGGVRTQRGEGFDQDLTTARTTADFNMGKLILQLGYQYTDENFLGELREKHYFYLRGKRSF